MEFGKAVRGLALSAIAALAFAGTAQAVENTWTVYNSDDGRGTYICSGCQISWTHDITDNYGAPDASYFDPAQWIVTDADLYVYLRDDSYLDSGEYVRFRFDGNSWTPGDNEVNNGTAVHADLNNAWLADGVLNIVLRSDGGDFIYDYAKLVVTAVRRVSEPGTLALLGLGLMALGFAARRRAK